VIFALGVAALAPGCAENCQDSCSRIYDECNISIIGVPADKSQADCEAHCEAALEEVGEMGGYDPWKKDNPLNPNTLNNEKQAAAWMDCVAETPCADMDPSVGICAPI
jgi:hypothetical protein